MGVDLSQGGLPAVPERPSGPIQAIEDALNAVNGVGQKFAEGMVGLFGMIRDALFGNYTGDIPELVVIQDGMTDLNDKVEVLDDVPGYVGTFMSMNRTFNAGGTWRTIPFDQKYGPEKRGHVDVGSHKIVMDRGSWSAHFTIASGNTTGTGYILRALVRDHNDNLVITRRFDWQSPNLGWDMHYAMPIIATQDGWSIELQFRHTGSRSKLLGGTEKTLMWVERKNLDIANSAIVTDVPDGPDIN